jgi:hypothetical protein
MRPGNRREFDEANLLGKPFVVMVWTNTVDFGQRTVRSTNVYGAEVAPLVF